MVSNIYLIQFIIDIKVPTFHKLVFIPFPQLLAKFRNCHLRINLFNNFAHLLFFLIITSDFNPKELSSLFLFLSSYL